MAISYNKWRTLRKDAQNHSIYSPTKNALCRSQFSQQRRTCWGCSSLAAKTWETISRSPKKDLASTNWSPIQDAATKNYQLRWATEMNGGKVSWQTKQARHDNDENKRRRRQGHGQRRGYTSGNGWLSKTFDTVDFEIFIRKLQKLNLSISSLKILASYLSNRRQYVQINDAESQTLPVTNGVPREALWVRFFSTYKSTTWAPRLMQHVTSMLTMQACTGTQNQKTWRSAQLRSTKIPMEFKVGQKILTWSSTPPPKKKKKKSLLFTTQQMARRHQLNIGLKSADGKVIERVLHFKLLGVIFSEDLKWNKTWKGQHHPLRDSFP